MGKKTFIAAIIASLLILSSVGMQAVEVAVANPVPTAKPTNPPNIVILSPQDRIYYQNDIQLNFTVDFTPGMFVSLAVVYYRLDEGPIVFLNAKGPYSSNLTGVNRGKHFLTVYADVEGRYYPNYPNSTVTDGFSLEGTKSTWFTVVTELESPSPTISPSISPTPSPAPILNELPYLVEALIPPPNSINVPLNSTIAVSFARLPSICNLSITPNVAIKERVNSSERSGVYDAFYFLIDQLEPQTTYTATVTYGQETAPEGYKPTTNRTWQFTTGTSINPPPSPSPAISPSPTSTPIPSSTQTPTIQPSPTPNKLEDDFAPLAIAVGLVVAVAVVITLVYFKKRRGLQRK